MKEKASRANNAAVGRIGDVSVKMKARREGAGDRRNRPSGGRGGEKPRHGKKGHAGTKLLETINACEEDIILTCSFDMDFDLDDLVTTLESHIEEKEEAREEKQTKREGEHAALLKACPALVAECNMPLELPTPVEGERPDKDAIKAAKEAFQCVKEGASSGEGVEEMCIAHLDEMEAEREIAKAEMEAAREAARESGERPSRGPDEETREMIKAVRVCLQEEVKLYLEEGSQCLAALSPPEKEEEEVAGILEEAVLEKPAFDLLK